jgi:hypothetical protein
VDGHLGNCKSSMEEYDDILSHAQKSGRELGIDKTLKDNKVDVILGLADGALFYIAAIAGLFRLFLYSSEGRFFYDRLLTCGLLGYPIASLPPLLQEACSSIAIHMHICVIAGSLVD